MLGADCSPATPGGRATTFAIGVKVNSIKTLQGAKNSQPGSLAESTNSFHALDVNLKTS